MPHRKPHLALLLIHTIQLVSSIIVAAITSYFLYELHRDHYRLPWTFILLLTSSLLTLLTLLIASMTSLLHPRINTPSPPAFITIAISSLLLVLWAASFILLTRWTSFSGTLSHACSPKLWDSSIGVTICRLYKALFAFSLFGLLGAAAALALHVLRWRDGGSEGGGRGRFEVLGANAKTSEPQRDGLHGHRQGDGEDEGEGMMEREMQRREEDVVNPNPMAREKYRRFRVGRNKTAKGAQPAGYTIPEEQFDRYNENDEITEYRGAGGNLGRSDRV